MAIQHYGLDEAEIENLKAAHLTDEEINDLNKKRVQEQMEDDEDQGFEDVDASEKAIIDILPNAPKIVASFINQRIGSPHDGIQLPDELKKLNEYFKSNQGAAHSINEAVKNVPVDSLDFSIEFPEASDEDIVKSGIDFNTTAFITELIVNAMKDAGLTEPDLIENKFLG